MPNIFHINKNLMQHELFNDEKNCYSTIDRDDTQAFNLIDDKLQIQGIFLQSLTAYDMPPYSYACNVLIEEQEHAITVYINKDESVYIKELDNTIK